VASKSSWLRATMVRRRILRVYLVAVSLCLGVHSAFAQTTSTTIPFPLPISDPTALSLLTFFVQHDSYHVGQLALLRKHAGLPAMQYA
jgi:hypothetical protein